MLRRTNPVLPDRTDVLIIGAGAAGLAMGRQLRRAGVRDFIIAERGDSPGGVWRANAYPGAACDVPSHLYSFSFLPNPDWTRKFAPQSEIKAYFERASVELGLIEHLHLGCCVRTLNYDAEMGCWRVEFADGARLAARIVVSAVGQLSEPFSPQIEDRARFQGQCVHTAEWTSDIDMSGKHVVLIGNAASAIQLMPHAAEQANHLTVFQRTPNWIIPKPDRAFTGFEKALFRYLPGYHWLYRMGSFLIHESRWPAFVSRSWAARYTRWRLVRHIRKSLPEPELQAKLMPDYAPGCKRVLLSNDVFDTLKRSSVDLNTDGVAAFESHGVVSGAGERVPADLVIFATGFKATQFLPSLKVVGDQDQTLHEVWGDSPSAYKGVAVSGFPNLFMMYGPNTNLGHNSIIFMLERQAEYIGRKISRFMDENLKSMAVRLEAQTAFNARLQGRLERTVWAEDCPSWYKSADGVVTNNWTGLASAFALTLNRRDDQDWLCESKGSAQS